MFSVISTSTKIAVFAFSAGLSLSALDAVSMEFQSPAHQLTVVELPTVVVVGYRASLDTDSMRVSAKDSGKAAI